MIDICNELHQNFIDFAYEANSERAFPDARDGLKPGQRACLWEMYSKGYTSDKPHVKSAKISGGTAAQWWPHGTTAIYETFGRMSMPWVNNVPEVDWHGNNGNAVIGQALAADRYTEARLAKIVEEGMFAGIKKNNVPMILNFSEDEKWPEVLPSVFPRLLVNGSQGIGLTIANTWIPMNFKECGQVIIDKLNNKDIDFDNLYLIDFPSGGIIENKKELPIIHKTGKGKVILRGKYEINKNIIKITELPYQVYVEPFINSIKKLVEEGKTELIKEVYNKTDKNRLLVEIECISSPETVLNLLLSETELRTIYNANQWALIGKTPKLLTLNEYIDIYITHNIECITREYQFDLAKNQARKEIVDGLLKALEDIDNVIELIKKSKSSTDAITNLMNKYSLNNIQAKAIVDMKLGRLANLERIELQNENNELIKAINDINNILCNNDNKKQILINRLQTLINKYGADRKTELLDINFVKSKKKKEEVEVEPEKVVVIFNEDGTIKRIPASSFKIQNRNTKGVKTTGDIVKSTIRTNTVDSLLVFTNLGKVYKMSVNDIPVGSNASKGQLISSLIKMNPGEKACLVYSIYKDTEAKFIVFVTANGIIKKSPLAEFLNIRKNYGTSAITLAEGDALASVALANSEDIIILTKNGIGIRFNLTDVSPTGKTSRGVKGIALKENDTVIDSLIVRNTDDMVGIFSSSGLGKKINISDITLQHRGGKGLIIFKSKAATVIGGSMLSDEDELLLIGSTNSLCISAKDIPATTRIANGNIMIKGGALIAISKI